MSNPHRSYLPPEILDYIIDLLDDGLETLGECCLVSKSWVPRTRKHLFAEVWFQSAAKLWLWKKTFPDHASSPAYHTHTLFVGCPGDVTVADAEQGGWIRSFSRVVELVVYSSRGKPHPPEVSLIPFHGFSPVLKCLDVYSSTLSTSETFALISSLPLLEDLTLSTCVDEDDPNFSVPLTVFKPTSPALAVDLSPSKTLERTARKLLGSPNGLHFRTIVLSFSHGVDIQWITALVVGCSRTLESLTIMSSMDGAFVYFPLSGCSPFPFKDTSGQPSIDLTEATKLGDVLFDSFSSWNVEWMTLTLQTITPNHRNLRQISIYLDYDYDWVQDVREAIGEAVCEWLALDRVLVQLWESYSIRSKIKYSRVWRREKREEKEVGEFVGCLLPETTKKGIIDLVEWDGYE